MTTSKHSTPLRKQPPSQQINSLYREFESLKSQIYYSKSNKKDNTTNVRWDNTQNYQQAQSVLRESTIRKYSKQFKQQLQLIKQSRRHHHNKQPLQINRQLFSELESSPEQHQRKIKNEQKWVNLFSMFKSKINIEEQRQHQDIDVLSTVLQNCRQSKQKMCRGGIDLQPATQIISNALQDYENYHNQLLYILIDRLNFFNKKMSCLQKIIVECSKIIKLSNQTKRSKQLSENLLLINIKTLQSKYQTQIKQLIKHYQDKIAHLNKQLKYKRTHSYKQSDNMHGLEEENAQLKLILQQTKKLLTTKQEIITSLQQQNSQLKGQVLKISHQKSQFSLGYSMTGRKLKVSTQKMNSSQPEKHKWQQMPQPEQDINFNQLESVKEKSFEDWDISHLQMRQNTNTKSMAGDFKEIYDNQIDEQA